METKKQKVSNVPNLRFPGYYGEWKQVNLGGICKMQAGKFVGASEIYESQTGDLYPCYGGNGLRGYTKTFNQDGKYALIGRQGALCGNVTLVNGKFHATEHAVVVYPYNEIDTTWCYYLLNHLNLNQYATGMAQPGLSVQNLDKVTAKIPSSLEEQKSIAKCLELIDKRIESQNKIIEKLETLIKYLRENLFCDIKSPIPRARFHGFEGKWTMVKLVDIVSRVIRRNKENTTTLPLTIAAKHGLVDQKTYFNKQIASKNMSNYYLLLNGDFAYNKSYSNDYPWGAVKRLDLYDKGALSSLYICFRPKDNVKSDYLAHYFETTKWHKGISDISGEGARNHGLLNMSVDDYFNTSHYIPNDQEQDRIACFLNSLSDRLSTENNMLQSYEKQKNYLLQTLFI